MVNDPIVEEIRWLSGRLRWLGNDSSEQDMINGTVKKNKKTLRRNHERNIYQSFIS